MSTTPTQPQAPSAEVVRQDREIRIYSHSPLFYWWPVWAVGFLMALITLWDGYRMVLVPSNTAITPKEQGRVELVLPPNTELPLDPANPNTPQQPKLLMARSKNLGVLYATVLVLIIFISNVPLRGLWSVITVLGIVLLVVIFALMEWWEKILAYLGQLDVRINMGGYIFISFLLFIIWAVTIFIFDRRRYLAVSSGQVRLVQAVGAGEDVWDTTGMTFAKRQDDLFRHWIVGMGSGDLIIHRPNQAKDVDLPNVLFIGNKIKEIERLTKEREVV